MCTWCSWCAGHWGQHWGARLLAAGCGFIVEIVTVCLSVVLDHEGCLMWAPLLLTDDMCAWCLLL